ncbi:MAG: class III poly(R)-hydroxyalkanoic acid synthase subunit PhaE [Magnetococcales bacterium]|nr:class III poly(R)-hydroxyalkanoic acid synthase subunit PhaE [Magnetococcales bacterium]
MDNNPFSTEWMTGWSDLQRKIWEDWSEVTQSTWSKNFQAETPLNFFRDGMNRWPGMMSGSVAPESMAVKHAVSAMENFLRMGKEVFRSFQNASEAPNPASDWTAQLERAIQAAKDMFSNSSNPLGALAGMAGMAGMGGMGGMGGGEDLSSLWNRPLKAWNDFLTTNPAFANEAMRTMLSGGQSLDEQMNRILSMPGLGFNRERQEKLQEGMRLSLEYRKAAEEFQNLTRISNHRALDLLHKKLLELAAEGKSLQTLRELYVLWVDCSEEANAAMVTTREFNELNARMTNALMRVRGHMVESVDNTLSAMHMPTRRELDSAHRQIAQLKRRVQSLEDEIKELRTNDAGSEINALRDDMEKLGVRRLRDELADLKKRFQDSLHAAPVEVPAEEAVVVEKSAVKKPVRMGNRPAAGGSVQKGE